MSVMGWSQGNLAIREWGGAATLAVGARARPRGSSPPSRPTSYGTVLANLANMPLIDNIPLAASNVLVFQSGVTKEPKLRYYA